MTKKKSPSTPAITVVLITYNSRKFLASCLKALEKQTYPKVEIHVIDNASQDECADWIAKHFPKIRLTRNAKNLGYVGAANQAMALSETEYFMIVNPDVILTPTYIARAIESMQEDPRRAAITGKVLKYDFEHKRRTKQIDTTGLYCYRNRRVIDRGQGMMDHGQYDRPEEIFGVSGACPIYRKTALDDAKIDGEVLDENFFMYKEDVDLSWRFHLLGWTCFYEPAALAYHGRGTGVLKRFTHWEVYKGRHHLSRFQKYYAYKNQRLMQIKNELWGNFLQDFFTIAVKEIIISGYILVREPYLFKAVGRALIQLPSTLKKRRSLMRRRKADARTMARWFGRS